MIIDDHEDGPGASQFSCRTRSGHKRISGRLQMHFVVAAAARACHPRDVFELEFIGDLVASVSPYAISLKQSQAPYRTGFGLVGGTGA